MTSFLSTLSIASLSNYCVIHWRSLISVHWSLNNSDEVISAKLLLAWRQESEPALISVIVPFLLPLSELKYHWPKSGKGEQTVNLLCFVRSNLIPMEPVIYRTFS